jgi:Ni,Fe-hydrogenase III large subunit
LEIRLGFTHRGIERMFQSHMTLLHGWRLAEQVSGDSSFAHSMAYCRAAEQLTDTTVPPGAEVLRAVPLELERMHNHIADLAALAEQVALSRRATDLARIRERLLRLNYRLTGHRYLRGVNRVGGLRLSTAPDIHATRSDLASCGADFERVARRLAGKAAFRDRTIDVGIVTADEALSLGVCGVTARASGVARDCRWEHPEGAYKLLRDATDTDGLLTIGDATIGDPREASAGDVFARALTRIREVQESRYITDVLLGELESLDLYALTSTPRVRPANNYTWGLGFAEGFRGDIVYWVMQDKMNGIYRCKVRDPSMVNWPALAVAASPRLAARRSGHGVEHVPVETMLADFPLVNRSFNLSYAGNDL